MIHIEEHTFLNPLFIFAMESEAGNSFDDVNTVFTGLGKINAGYHLLKAISRFSPDIIVNLGTAGSSFFARGELVCCTNFIQRDMDVSSLGFSAFQTPFESIPIVLTNGIALPGFSQGTCGSGDNFEVGHKTDAYNVIDMEGYALAKVALLENIPFISLKFISDGADDSAASDWTESVKLAAQKLRSAIDRFMTKVDG